MDNSTYIDGDEKETEPTENGKVQSDKSLETPSPTYTFNEAIALTGCGKFHYQLLWTSGLCFLTVMSQVLCVSIILPAVKCDIPATLQEQGLLGSAGFFGVVLSSHAMGFLGDTWGRVRTLKWSLILSTVVAIISAFSPSIWMLILTRLLTGIFSAGCQACVFSLCSEFHSDKTRARHVTIISAFLSFSVIYIPIEAILILPLKISFTLFGMNMSPWRLLLLAVNIVPFLALLLLNFTPETPKYDLAHGNHNMALKTMRHMFEKNTGRPGEEYPVKRIKLEKGGANIADIHNVKDAIKMIWQQTIPLFYKERIFNTLNICFILAVSYGISHGLFMWYPTIFNDEINRDGDNVCRVISEINILDAESSNVCAGKIETLTYWILIFNGVVITVLYLIFAYAIDYTGKRMLLVFWLTLCGLFSIAMPFISSLPFAILTLTILGAACNSGGIVGTIAVEYFPTNINAMAMCFAMMMGRLGAVAGNNTFGHFLFDECEWTFWSVAIILFFTAFMSWFLPEKKGIKL